MTTSVKRLIILTVGLWVEAADGDGIPRYLKPHVKQPLSARGEDRLRLFLFFGTITFACRSRLMHALLLLKFAAASRRRMDRMPGRPAFVGVVASRKAIDPRSLRLNRSLSGRVRSHDRKGEDNTTFRSSFGPSE